VFTPVAKGTVLGCSMGSCSEITNVGFLIGFQVLVARHQEISTCSIGRLSIIKGFYRPYMDSHKQVVPIQLQGNAPRNIVPQSCVYKST